jgi:hypothetical protein
VFEVVKLNRWTKEETTSWYKLRLVRITAQPRGAKCDCDFHDCEHQVVTNYDPTIHNSNYKGVLGNIYSAHYQATFDEYDFMKFKFMGQKCTAVRRKSDEEFHRDVRDRQALAEPTHNVKRADASWYD